MPLFPVDSIDDPRLMPYRELNQRNLTRHSGLFIAEGDKVVDRLIASRSGVESLLAEPEDAARYAPLLEAETPVYVASRKLLQATIGFNFHRGVLACGRRPPRMALGPVLAAAAAAETLVVCPEVHDPTNLGSIIRVAAAFGCLGMVLGKRCADPFSRRVLRVSMGAVLQMPMIESTDLAADLAQLAAARFQLVATVVGAGSEPLDRSQRPPRLALLLGCEGHGLAPEWLALADRHVTIPMQRGIDSLNVAMAAAVLLYHYCQAAE